MVVEVVAEVGSRVDGTSIVECNVVGNHSFVVGRSVLHTSGMGGPRMVVVAPHEHYIGIGCSGVGIENDVVWPVVGVVWVVGWKKVANSQGHSAG